MTNTPNHCLKTLDLVALFALSMVFVLTACGDGGGGDNSGAQSTSGVVSYDLIAERSTGSSTDALEKAGLATKGSVVPAVNDIVNIAALVYPALAPVAKMTGWLDDAVNEASVNNQLNEIFGDINQLQTQVDTLQDELNFLNSDFMKFVVSQTATDAYIAWTSFSSYINNITSSSTGTYYIFQSAARINPTETPNYTQIVSQIPQINEGISGLNQPFVTAINNLSASELPIDADGDQIYKSVASMSDSALQNLYIQMQDFLYVNFPVFPSLSSGGNITTAINQYNSQIIYVFQISAAALQAAYTVDAAINQINYYQGTLSPGATPPAYQLETNPGIYYAYSSDLSAAENETAYGTAQQQLALVYASRFNSLFNLTVKYLISDPPLEDFKYPSILTGNPDIDNYYANDSYQTIYGSTAPSSKMQSTSTIGQNFPAISVPDSSGYVFYLFTALNQFTACQNAFIQGQALTELTCPSLYGSYDPAAQSGVYDGQNLNVWVLNPSSNQAMLTISEDLNTRCSSSAMSNQTWEVSTAVVEANDSAGFSCPASVPTPVSSPSYTPNWQYSPAITDPNNYFYWEGSNLSITNATGSHVSYSAGSFSIKTADVPDGSYFDVYLTTSNNSYQGAIVMKYAFTDLFNVLNITFSIYCSTHDPLCVPHQSGVCLGGRYLTFVMANSNTGKIVDNGSC